MSAPLRAPELRKSLAYLHEPRDPKTGKWIKGGAIAEAAVSAARVADVKAAAKAPPEVKPAKAAEVKPSGLTPTPGMRPEDQTPEQLAAQKATRQQSLAFTQHMIMQALTTPPENMTDQQAAVATNLIMSMTGQDIDKIREQLLPLVHKDTADTISEVVSDLHDDLDKSNASDARGVLIRHIAWILAGAAAALAATGLALPALLAGLLTALPAVAQEVTDFRADADDWVSKHKAEGEHLMQVALHGPGSAKAKAAKVQAQSADAKIAEAKAETLRAKAAQQVARAQRDEGSRAALVRAELRTAETPVASTVPEPHGKPGGGLWGHPGLMAPPYIEHVAGELMKAGHSESDAYHMAVGIVQNWAAGHDGKGNKVHPDVQAAAARNVAMWDALKATYGSSSRSSSPRGAELWRQHMDAERSATVAYLEHRAALSTADQNNLPDSAFAFIKPGGVKDADGKTLPRENRVLPIHDAAHVRNALARLPQTDTLDDSQKAQAKTRIVAAAKQFGVEVGDDDGAGQGRSLLAEAETRELRITSQYRDLDSRLEIRIASDGAQWIGGYASVYMPRESRNLGGFIERVAPSAFAEDRAQGWRNVVCRYNHNNDFVLGTTAAGTLQMNPDSIGLDYQVMPPGARSDVRELVQRGDIRYSSFAFRCRPGGDEWGITDQNFPQRTLHDVELINVAPVLTPAYPDATAAMRATAPALRSLADHMQIAVDEVRSLAERDELRKLFIRTDRPMFKKQTPRPFGPAATIALLARREDPYISEG